MLVGGIDIGTTGTKLTIFDDGKIIDSFYRKYDYDRFSSEDEIDASLIRNAVLCILESVFAKYPLIEKLGVTSFGETFVCLDKDDNILYPSFLYTSKVGDEEKKELENNLGQKLIGEITGLKIDSMFSLPKIMYIKNKLPLVFQKIDKILLIEDFITYTLTGSRYIDYSLATRTLCFNVYKKTWSKTILNAVGISSSFFSKPCRSGTFCGNLRNNIKNKFNINHDVKVYAIAHDQIANAIGSGVVKEGFAVDGNGTCECISICYDMSKIEDNSFLYEQAYCVVPYVNNLHISYILNYTAGALIDWVINTYFQDINLKDGSIFEYLNSNMPSNIHDLLVLPYFSGNATPYADKDVKGAIINLSLNTTRYDIYKATLESLCFEMKLNIDNFKEHGVKIDKLIASGGGSSNDVYLQMKADILNIPIYKLAFKDAGTIGAYILMNDSKVNELLNEENSEKILEISKVFTPNHDLFDEYNKKYLHYKNMYKQIKGI